MRKSNLFSEYLGSLNLGKNGIFYEFVINCSVSCLMKITLICISGNIYYYVQMECYLQ